MDYKVYVRAIVLNADGDILMLQKNAEQKIAPSQWLLPGGAVEFGETAEAAFKRELVEETGMVVQAAQLLGEDVRIIGSTHWHGLIFHATGDATSIHNAEPQKHAVVQWRDRSFVQGVLSSQELRALNLLQRR